MYRTYEARLALANRIYELDTEVYGILGSGLGRVFSGKQESVCRDLAKLMAAPTKIHYLRSEIALIGNMAKTISNREVKARVLEEYEAIVKEVESLPEFFGTEDILDEDIARITHTAVGTVKSRLNRARKKLSELLEQSAFSSVQQHEGGKH